MGKQQKRKAGPAYRQPKNRAKQPALQKAIVVRKTLKVKQCVMIIDGPNINSFWYTSGKKLVHGHFSYHRLRENYKKVLEEMYPDHVIILKGVILFNTREDRSYHFFEKLAANNDDWKIISKPKVEDSDIDENIVNLVHCYIRDRRFDHIVLVGNDLQNHLPLFHEIRGRSLQASLICFIDRLSPKRISQLARYEVTDFTQLVL